MKQFNKEMDIIYRRYYKDVFCFARSLTGNVDIAEEVTQNTFCKAIQAAHKFRGDCDIRVWLCQIAKNDYFNYLRKEKRNVSGFVEEDVFLNVPDTAQPVINRIEDEEEAKEIREVLERMEEPYKTVFSLRVIHELSYENIAKSYGKTESWARVAYYRAKSKIIDSLKR